MNLFWKLTHHRFRQRLRIVVRNVSVGRRPTNLSTLYALLRHSSIHRVETSKNAISPYTRSSAYLSLIFLFVAKAASSSSARDEVFPRFPSWSMTRDSASRRVCASTHDRSRTRARDIVTYAITLDSWKCVEDTRPTAHSWAARCRLRPFRFADRLKKLSLSLTFRVTSIVYRARLSNDPLRFPFPRSLVSFSFFFYVGFNEADSRPSLRWICWRNIYTVRCVKDKSDIGCTRIRFSIVISRVKCIHELEI